MQIVISGALPDPAEARELIKYMQDTAPALSQWLNTCQAKVHSAKPADTLCTPEQQYRLHMAGFQPTPAQHLSAGLGPLLLQNDKSFVDRASHDTVWLAQLVHIAPSRDGALLIPAHELAISAQEGDALLQAVLPYLPDSGFHFTPGNLTHWQVSVPDGFTPSFASPELVALSNLNDWWSQDIETRPWRRLVNEFQMLAFDHPVNHLRQQQGKLAINSLWLYGGAYKEQLKSAHRAPRIDYWPSLNNSFNQRDWGSWLAELKLLDSRFQSTMHSAKPSHVVLLGREQYAITAPAAKKAWPLNFFTKPHAWSRWWSPLS